MLYKFLKNSEGAKMLEKQLLSCKVHHFGFSPADTKKSEGENHHTNPISHCYGLNVCAPPNLHRNPNLQR